MHFAKSLHRHDHYNEYEASGCVPVLQNTTELAPGSLAFMDKALLSAAAGLLDDNALRDSQVQRSAFDYEAYQSIASKLLRHTQRRLTTEALARYTLAAAGHGKAKKVLYLANCLHGDYQCYLSLHGMRRVLGEGLVDFPRLGFMYRPPLGPLEEIVRKTNCPQSMCTTVTGSYHKAIIRNEGAPIPVYGGGFSYGYRLEDLAGVNRSWSVLVREVKQHSFDLVVVGNAAGLLHEPLTRQQVDVAKLWELVAKHYGPEEIVLIDGRDPPEAKDQVRVYKDVWKLATRGHFFLREIPDDICAELPMQM
eukprot:TRINITY_DN53995_c0_g1_i3.p1 TRINITY_DN53995_c0_g1~~TRINITY_DN53995_c0_g1_i3.p1  ORF type:complete len:307 (+),score=32.06 TRINITY_DN53995_c0_g1_i3:105-1025(+)